MDRRTVLGFGAASMAAAAAGATAAAPSADAATITVLKGKRADYAPALAALGGYMQQHVTRFGLPGMTAGVADGEGFAAVLQVGLADVERRQPFHADRLVQIGSISKSLVGLAAFRLIQAHRLQLATPVQDLLPEVPWPDGATITIGHLLNHSSGLPDDAPIFPRGGDGRLWRGFEPGAAWSYSNTGYELLGLALERLEDKPLAEILRAQVFAPLGMDAAVGALRAEDRPRYAVGYRGSVQDLPPPTPGPLSVAPWVDFTSGAGCVAATPGAMTAYLRYLIDAGRGHGGPLLDDAHAQAYCAPSVAAPGWGMPGARYAQGLAVVETRGRSYLHHTGGMVAFNSSLHVDAAGGVGAFASTNVGLIPYRPRAVTLFACELLRAAREGHAPPAPPRLEAAIDKAASYVGTYRAAAGEPFVVEGGADGLRLSAGGTPAVLEPVGDNQFLAHHPRFNRYVLLFERQNDRVVGAWYGPTFFAATGQPVERPPVPAALAAMAGRYDNDDPWRGVTRVVARPDGLWLDGVEPLKPIGEGLYRVGADANGTERARFDAVVGGRPTRLNLSGVDYLRRDDPS